MPVTKAPAAAACEKIKKHVHALNRSQVPEATMPLDCISTDVGTLVTGGRVKSRDLSLYVQSSRGSACRRGHVKELLDDELKCRGCNGWVINPEGGLGHRTVRGRPLGAPGFSAR